ncbi:MAG: Gfo/Idh/MocA family oxidoreductase [Candidatus Brocadiia bacterium]
MSQPLRVAVVGAGHLGRHHARLYAAIPHAQLVAVADIAPDRARNVAQAYGARPAADHRDLLAEVDAVSIAVPTESHFAVAKDFIERGVAVLVEKPFTRSLEEADELLALAGKNGVPIQVGHVERFNPALVAAKRYLTTPLYVHCDRIGPFTFRSLDIGVVLDLMIHDLDILLDLVDGPVETIEAVGVPVLSPHEDIANVRLTFASGCVASLTASRVATHAVRKVRIFQPDAYISLDYGQRKALLYRKRQGDIDPTSIDPSEIPDLKAFVFEKLIAVEEIPMEEHDALEAELLAFLHSVATGQPPSCSGHDARRAIELATRILRGIEANLRTRGPFAP